MQKEDTYQKMHTMGFIPVVIIDDVDSALPLADILIEAGLPVVEITFRTPSAADIIKKLRQHRPDLLLGAGTVLTTENIEKAHDAGVDFAVAPGLNPAVVKKAAELDLPFIPGVQTATEIENALSLGLKYLKFFPAHIANGLKLLTELSGPYYHTGLRFMATGGVDMTNMTDYLKLPIVFCTGGTCIAQIQDIENKDWQKIKANTQKVLQIINQTK